MLMLAVISISVTVVELEVAWNGTTLEKSSLAQILKAISSSLTAVLVFRIWKYYRSLLKKDASKANVLAIPHISSSKYKWMFFMEVIVCSAHAPPYMDFTWKLSVAICFFKVIDRPFVNDKFGLLVLARLYLGLRVVRDSTSVFRKRQAFLREKGTQMAHAKFGVALVFKAQKGVRLLGAVTIGVTQVVGCMGLSQYLFQRYAFQTLLGFILVSFTMMTYLMYICEREMQPEKFGNLKNAAWKHLCGWFNRTPLWAAAEVIRKERVAAVRYIQHNWHMKRVKLRIKSQKERLLLRKQTLAASRMLTADVGEYSSMMYDNFTFSRLMLQNEALMDELRAARRKRVIVANKTHPHGSDDHRCSDHTSPSDTISVVNERLEKMELGMEKLLEIHAQQQSSPVLWSKTPSRTSRSCGDANKLTQPVEHVQLLSEEDLDNADVLMTDRKAFVELYEGKEEVVATQGQGQRRRSEAADEEAEEYELNLTQQYSHYAGDNDAGGSSRRRSSDSQRSTQACPLHEEDYTYRVVINNFQNF
eukprot:gene4014-4981_t